MTGERTQDQTLRDYIRVLRRRRTLIVTVTLVAAVAALLYSLVKTPTYEAVATLDFGKQDSELTIVGTPAAPSNQPDKVAAANARAIVDGAVVLAVKESLRTELPAARLRTAVRTAVQPTTNLVTVTASWENAEFAAKLANAFAQEGERVKTEQLRGRYKAAARDLRRSTGGDRAKRFLNTERIARLDSLAVTADPVDIADRAGPPAEPTSPRPLRDTLLATILGLMVGCVAAFVRDAFDRRITDSHQVQHELRLPLVGYVSAAALGHAGLGSNGAYGTSEEDLDAFRILRSNAEFLDVRRSLRSLAVTSPVAEEGKSTVAVGLAVASAVTGKRTLLVECDLRRPVVAKRLGLSPAPGLTDYLTGDASPKDVVQVARFDQGDPDRGWAPVVQTTLAGVTLPCIVAGNYSARPAELLGSQRFHGFLDQVSRAYDLVVLDCAPILPVGDTLELVPQVDGVLLCIRLEQTTREQAVAAKTALDHFPSRPTGLVITGLEPGSENDYYGYYSSTAEYIGAARTGQ
jgi:Mrp family chromosome partitioning ATPase